MDKTRILGVKIDNIRKKEALKEIEGFLVSNKQHYVVTTNPEFLVEAQKNEEFYHILNRASLSLADGFGIILMSLFFPPRVKEHIRGSDLTEDVLLLAEKSSYKVYILNWEQGLSKKDEIKNALKNKFPELIAEIQNTDREGKNIDLRRINRFSPDILLVSLGAPYQERVVYHNLFKISSVKLAMGVGGTFDFLTKRIRRAPKLLRELELEWLWRLVRQPKRYQRILKAILIFPYLALVEKIIHPFFYRPNVACLMYKKNGDKINIFLAERQDEPGHFQLPQGGTEGQSLKSAGRRELMEELGTDKFDVRASFKNVHKYKFRKYPYKKVNGDFYKHTNYKGQRQGLIIAEFRGNDYDIKILPYDFSCWKWVPVDKVLDEIAPIRRRGLEKFLEKFKGIDK